MCYEVFLDGRARERSVRDLLRLELRDAVVNGGEAALLVAVVLLWQGTPLWLVGVSAATAVPLGAALHQVVLVVGTLAIRARARHSSGSVGST